MSKKVEELNIETPLNATVAEEPLHVEPVPGRYRVMRRNGKVTAYNPHKIVVAMTKAFLSVEGSSAAASSRIHNEVENLTDKVDQTIRRRFPNGGVVHIEDIQDQVELAIMRAGYQDVARAYVIYREDRAKARKLGVEQTDDMPISKNMILDDGSSTPIDFTKLKNLISESCLDIKDVSEELIFETIDKNIYDGTATDMRREIDAYEFYDEQNNEKRKIRILDKRFVIDIKSEVELMFGQNYN